MRLSALACACGVLTLTACSAPPEAQEPSEVAAIRELLPELQDEVSALRGQAFSEPVKLRSQTPEAFRRWLRETLDTDYPKAIAARDVELLSAFALMPQGYDLRGAIVSALAAETFAYYEHHSRALILLKVQADPETMRSTLLHELVHALQDQTYGLSKQLDRFNSPDFDRGDEALAFRMLMEGEATYFQFKSRYARVGAEDRLAADLETRSTGSAASLSPLAGDPSIPEFLIQQIVAPYAKGPLFVQKVCASQGTAALDSLFKNPPTSSEQILHPNTRLVPTRDAPSVLELPDLSDAFGPGAELRARETFGEFGCRLIFKALTGNEHVAACKGWDGDRAQAYSRPGEAWPALVWALTFDTPPDAIEFAQALRTAQQASRLANPPPLTRADVSVAGRDVLVVAGAPAGQLARIQKAAGFKRTK